MRKYPASQSGLFNPRVLVALALCSLGVFLAMFGFAATPPTGRPGWHADSPGRSPFVGNPDALGGNATAAATSMPFAPAAAGDWSIVPSPNASAGQTDTYSST